MTRAYVYWLHRPEHTDPFTEGYIGVSIQPLKRFYQHKKQYYMNPHLAHVFKKHNDIMQSILLVGPEDYCYEIEAKMRPCENIAWNIAMGGNRPIHNVPHSLEAKAKMSLAKVEAYKGVNNPFYGKKHSEATKQRISQFRIGKPTNKGIPRTEEEKRKISVANTKDNYISWKLNSRCSSDEERRLRKLATQKKYRQKKKQL
jgi:hypothetical protein